jgi:hypothetical protein
MVGTESQYLKKAPVDDGPVITISRTDGLRCPAGSCNVLADNLNHKFGINKMEMG